MSTRAAFASPDSPVVSSSARVVDTIPATLILTALTAITAIGFSRVFSGWEFLGPMLFVAIIIHAVCLGLRLLNVPGYIALPVSVLVLFALVAWKYYPTTLAGPFPTSRTWDFLSTDLQLSRDQFPNAVAPVAAVGGFVVTATTAVGFAAILADAFAFRAYGRAEAVVPSAVLFVFAAALGIDSHRVALTAAWLVCALILIGVLRAAHDQTEQAWVGSRNSFGANLMPLVATLAVIGALGGAIIGPALPGAGSKPLIKTNKRHDVTEVLSPLVDIRSRLISLSKTELFTVETSEPHYWRATGLPDFDGTTWGLPDRDLRRVSGAFATSGFNSHPVLQKIRVSALKGPLLPVAFSPTSIDSATTTYWVDDTGTIVIDDGLARGNRFDVVSSVVDISPDILRSTSSNNPPDDEEDLALPDNFPSEVRDTARQVTAGATTAYDKARALQDWFQTEFDYDLSVQRGHSNNAIKNFLRIKRGYCEQFSGAFAAMARSLGIPARVAVGFTQGELRSDGKYHVYGRNAHAWPEVWFDGIGWVSFEPTPGRGEPGTESYTGLAPDQAPAVGDVPGAAAPQPPVSAAQPSVPREGATPSSTVAVTTTTVPVQPASTGGDGGGMGRLLQIIFLVVLGAAATWLFLVPRVAHALQNRRAGHSPTDRIEQNWRRAARSLGLVGLAIRTGETPLEHATRIERKTGIDRHTLRALAVAATAAKYGHIGDEAGAERTGELAAEVIASVKRRLPLGRRLLVLADPRRADLLVAK